FILTDSVTNLGQGTLSTISGRTTASFTTASLAVSSHAITATYTGDGNFGASSSPTITQTVSKAITTMVVATSANVSALGQTISFTATVSMVAPGAGTPTGTVQFQ